jgi:hypothetical protein
VILPSANLLVADVFVQDQVVGGVMAYKAFDAWLVLTNGQPHRD